jgi:hypothetical protein
MIFQIFDFVLGSSFFQTRRAQVLTIEGDIAKRAKKTTTGCTWHNGLFSGMIIATGLIIHLQCRTGLSRRQRPVDGWKNIKPQPTGAERAGNQRLGIGRFFAQRRIATGADKHDCFLSWQLYQLTKPSFEFRI